MWCNNPAFFDQTHETLPSQPVPASRKSDYSKASIRPLQESDHSNNVPLANGCCRRHMGKQKQAQSIHSRAGQEMGSMGGQKLDGAGLVRTPDNDQFPGVSLKREVGYICFLSPSAPPPQVHCLHDGQTKTCFQSHPAQTKKTHGLHILQAATMGAASKILSVCLRLGELACSIIVLGIVGHFLSRLSSASVYADNRLIYTIVVASISTFASLMFMVPFTCSFLAFPFDFILFVLWLVAFCLLEVVSIHYVNDDTAHAMETILMVFFSSRLAYRDPYLWFALVLELLGLLLGRVLEDSCHRDGPGGYQLGWLLLLEDGFGVFFHCVDGISV